MAPANVFDPTSTANLIEIMAALTIFITISFHALSVYLAEVDDTFLIRDESVV